MSTHKQNSADASQKKSRIVNIVKVAQNNASGEISIDEESNSGKKAEIVS